MPSSWFKVDARLWREIKGALEQHGRHDLVERVEQSRRPGRRKKPEIAYRQLARMWERHRKRHNEGTNEEVAWGFMRAHEREIRKLLGLMIGRKIDPKGGPWETLRNAIARGKRESARIRARRRSNWRLVYGTLAGPQIVTDPELAEYLQAVVKSILVDKEPIGVF